MLPEHHRSFTLRAIIALSILGLVLTPVPGFGSDETHAQSDLGPAAERVWNRTDLPVQRSDVDRTWMWGPYALTGTLAESYAQSPDGERQVQYFDKSRMEVNDPHADDSDRWYVTNGLLATELVTGRVQVGDEDFESRRPAEINIAGDPDDPDSPTYASLHGLTGADPLSEGTTIVQTVNRSGEVGHDDSLAGYGVTAATYVPETNHTVASVFWEFMTASGLVYENGAYVSDRLLEDPVYVTGYPITEAYWATVKVNGEARSVLTQVFERRVLTYTPDNPEGWQVETGNIGRHYYEWRYGEKPPEGNPNPPAENPQPGLETERSNPEPEPEQAAPDPNQSGGSGYFSTLGVGASLPSGQECAARVRRSSWEPRPQNSRANQTTGTTISQIDGASAEGNARLAPRIDGNFTGTTDEIIQWGACKWGFDEDIVRAVAVMESWWDNAYVGDAGQSFGLLQVKRTVHTGTFPAARDSTAFNVDYALAWKRSCYEGYFNHWVQGNPRGDEWACTGHWYAGGNVTNARSYLDGVRQHLNNRTWEGRNF